MHRFFFPVDTSRKQNTINLTGPDAHHAADVLRVRRKEQVVVLNGIGGIFYCEVQEASRTSVLLQVLKQEQTARARQLITLLQAVPKGRLIEDIIEKATQLGVSRVIPLLTQRVVTRFDQEEAEKKQTKWTGAAIEAIKQCGLPWLPSVEKPLTIDEVKEDFDLQLVASLRSDARHPRTYFQNLKRDPVEQASIAVWIGPEGDFTPEELDTIQAKGALPVTLGPLVLRCETAAIYCLSIINYELQAR